MRSIFIGESKLWRQRRTVTCGGVIAVHPTSALPYAMSSTNAPQPPDGQFQPEIQGMRAIAVLAVIFAHAGLPGFPGGFTGVDVFFVISGFLITRLLMSEVARTGRIDLLRFWARRARRLLPNAYATLLGTVLLAIFLFPGYDPGTLAREVTFAALEVVNFFFAEKAVDYFQLDGPASPVLHFWSLSVEEQFYLVWPLLLLGAGLYFRKGYLRASALILGVIWCASFAASLTWTFIEQPVAYFHTSTRCWQLATGALLAVGWVKVEKLPQGLRALLAWLGLAAIFVSITAFTQTGHYPGLLALVPTFGAAALIAGFEAIRPASPLRRGLSLPIMQWIGARSYSWYLWHWPFLALPRVAYPDSPHIELIAIPASLLVAAAAYAWLEDPVRKGRLLPAAPIPTLAGAAMGLALVIGAGYLHRPALFLVNQEVAARLRQMEIASREHSQLYEDGCLLKRTQTEQLDCVYGDLSASRHAVLFGDSHAAHWFEPLNAAAKQTGWRLKTRTKSGCPSAGVFPRLDGYPSCKHWRERVMTELTGPDRPDLVIMSNFVNSAERPYNPDTGAILDKAQSERAWREGLRQVIKHLTAAGVKVLLIRDVPLPDKNYRSCILRSANCVTRRSEAIAHRSIDYEVAQEFGELITFADFTEQICGVQHCSAVQGRMLVYRDTHHLTATYAATFAPQMSQILHAVVEQRLSEGGSFRHEKEAELSIPVNSAVGRPPAAGHHRHTFQ